MGNLTSPELFERMKALVRSGKKLPSFTYPPGHPIGAFFDELSEIEYELRAAEPPTPQRVVDFLNGKDHLDGYFFGDPHPSGEAFWWRRHLSLLGAGKAA